jgi:biopolymer transport protein TolR
MLVLLIVFMISAPLLTAGVPVELPKTEAGALQDQTDRSRLDPRRRLDLRAGGPVPSRSLPRAEGHGRGDATSRSTSAPTARPRYRVVAQVMAALSTSGFTSINLITDTGGPSSGDKHAPELAAAP